MLCPGFACLSAIACGTMVWARLFECISESRSPRPVMAGPPLGQNEADGRCPSGFIVGARRLRTTVGTVLVKYLVIAVLAAVILPAVGRVTWAQALVPAAVVAVVAYLVGDRLALPVMGNAGAVVVDFALAVALFWLAPAYVPGVRLGFGGALTAGGAVAVFEILYHQYLLQRGVGVR